MRRVVVVVYREVFQRTESAGHIIAGLTKASLLHHQMLHQSESVASESAVVSYVVLYIVHLCMLRRARVCWNSLAILVKTVCNVTVHSPHLQQAGPQKSDAMICSHVGV